MPPAGFKRSRALWEQASSETGTKGLLRAVLYELQPVRYSEFAVYKDSAVVTGRRLFSGTLAFCSETLPAAAGSAVHYARQHASWRHSKMIAAAVAYYSFVRWIHSALDAGPVVLIVSALVAIFTVGLSDEKSSELSAYSVFNKGFQKLMGSVDADALLQQHVGGGMMMMQQQRQHQEGVREVDELPVRFQRPRQQQQQRPAAAAMRDEPNDDSEDENENPRQQHPNNNDNPNRARRTGKKARRGNAIEQRRELRAQREAAMAMGFGGGGDEAAMFRLLEDQAAVVGDDDDDEQ